MKPTVDLGVTRKRPAEGLKMSLTGTKLQLTNPEPTTEELKRRGISAIHWRFYQS